MYSRAEVDKIFKEIRKNAVIEVNDWKKLEENTAKDGIIVTKDKSIYRYRRYDNIMKSEMEKADRIYKDMIYKVKDLKEDDFSKITKFIENEIVNKKFNSEKMLEYSCTVRIKYKWRTKKIKNNKEIYTKTKELIESLLLSDIERKWLDMKKNNKNLDETKGMISNLPLSNKESKIDEQNEQTEFNKRLDEIRKNVVIQVSNWGGLGKNAGYGGVIVTDDKCIYTYKYYFNFTESEGKKANFIDKKDLTEEEFSKIAKFIEDEIANKEFEDIMMFDAGFKVEINYKGITKKIKNDREIYAKAKEIINTILEKIEGNNYLSTL